MVSIKKELTEFIKKDFQDYDKRLSNNGAKSGIIDRIIKAGFFDATAEMVARHLVDKYEIKPRG